MTFADLSAVQAERYRSRIEADGPGRLVRLTRLLAGDGVSLGEFDGRIGSLRPLWEWYVPFALSDFPGIPEDAAPRWDSVEPIEPGYTRSAYAAELIVHYMFRVAQTCFPSASWVVLEAPGMDSHRRTVVSYPNDEGGTGHSLLEEFSRNATGLAVLGEPEYTDPRFLEGNFLRGPFLCGPATASRCRAIPRGASVLEGLLDAEIPADLPLELGRGGDSKPGAPGPFVISDPIARESDHVEPDDEAGGELLFAHVSADIENLEKAPPLDLDTIVETLQALDVLDIDGAAPAKRAILAEEFAEFVRGDDAMITTLVSKRKLRAVQIASINPTESAWAEITDAFTRLAAPNNARLAPEDEFN